MDASNTGTFVRSPAGTILYSLYLLAHGFFTFIMTLLVVEIAGKAPDLVIIILSFKVFFHLISGIFCLVLLTNSSMHKYYKLISIIFVVEMLFSARLYYSGSLIVLALHIMSLLVILGLVFDAKSSTLADLRPFKFKSSGAVLPNYVTPQGQMPTIMYAYPPASGNFAPQPQVYPTVVATPMAAFSPGMPTQPTTSA